ncbi:MAG: tetratricopeptide repeat protein [Nonlabens sp.]|uniref:tetratricopeptide repeat protein n=1 Tax=Nonlabens sp. TaxID=1888209 RepID=UPI003EF84FA6
MKYLFTIFSLLLLVSCATAPEQNQAVITDINDFQTYLDQNRDDEVATLKEQAIALENDVKADSNRIVQMSRLAGIENQLYDLTGEIEKLAHAVSLRENVLRKTFIKPESARRALAQLYIKQHRFKEAHSLMNEVPANEKEDQLIKFDIAMELGDYENAEQLLNGIKNLRDYNYLIRAAKWNDYKGNLDDTIRLMEQAMELAEESGSESLMLWSYSNIADYYGHHGDLDLSYKFYLKTLELDPHNDYALKGISWIAFSNDDDPELAAQILNTLQRRHSIPDYKLSLADVYEHQGKEEKANQLRSEFLTDTENSSFGGMYNTYRIETMLSGDKAQQQAGLELAMQEVENRATPETYDLLGYSYLINNMPEKALEVHKDNVQNKTFEPVAQLHLAQVLKQNNQETAAMELKKELLEARYELGPVVIKEVESL